jgi:hypothetical protein
MNDILQKKELKYEILCWKFNNNKYKNQFNELKEKIQRFYSIKHYKSMFVFKKSEENILRDYDLKYIFGYIKIWNYKRDEIEQLLWDNFMSAWGEVTKSVH